MKWLFLIFCLLAFRSVQAADPITETGEFFLEQQRKQEQLERLQDKQQNIVVPEEFSGIPDEQQCFSVSGVVITGNTLLSQKELDSVLQQYSNKCLGKEGINQLMQHLTSKYIEGGYITSRVYIPPQDLTTGELSLVVIEGYIEAISINNNEASDRRKLWWAMPSDWDEHLRLPDIEQGLDQINRVRSANAEMKLWPGKKTGATHVQIINKTENEIRGELQVSNDGQEDTGRNRTRLGFEFDNLIGINDASSINYIGSTNTNAVAMSFSFPFRKWGFGVSHSYSEFLNILPQNTDLFGQSNTTTFSSDYMLYRDGSKRLQLINNVTVRRSARHVLGVELTPQKLVPIRLGINLSENKPWGFYSLEASYIHGTKLFGATQDDKRALDGAPQAQFSKTEYKVTVARPFSRSLSWQGYAFAQYTDDNLFSSEQLHLGDQSTVRGTDTTLASGERGFVIRNDLSWSVRPTQSTSGFVTRWLAGTRLGWFIDYGQSRTLTASNAESLAGTGLQLSYRKGSLALNTSWATLIQSRQEYAGQNNFYFSLTWEMF